jgi:hypothetical protein
VVEDPVEALLAAEVDPAARVVDVAGEGHPAPLERGLLAAVVPVDDQVAPRHDLVPGAREGKAHAQALEVGVDAVEHAARPPRCDRQPAVGAAE